MWVLWLVAVLWTVGEGAMTWYILTHLPPEMMRERLWALRGYASGVGLVWTGCLYIYALGG